MSLLICIDGTGPFSDREYVREMQHSFVRFIHTHSAWRAPGMNWYRRGPYNAGLAMPMIVGAACSWADMAHLAHPEEKYLLTGYSRGAAAVVAVAQHLERRRLRVSGMVLFDCVDRAVGVDASRVPTNVERLVHVMRSPSAGSRESFGRSGLAVTTSRTNYEYRFFHGTHGAMGGVPAHGGRPGDLIDEGTPDWGTRVTYAEDAEAARNVWRWVHPRLQRLGFRVRTRSLR